METNGSGGHLATRAASRTRRTNSTMIIIFLGRRGKGEGRVRIERIILIEARRLRFEKRVCKFFVCVPKTEEKESAKGKGSYDTKKRLIDTRHVVVCNRFQYLFNGLTLYFRDSRDATFISVCAKSRVVT